MKVVEIIDGETIIREATAEEVAEQERNQAEAEAASRQTPPSDFERIEAQTIYTAMMTDTLIEE